jgi:hypothetical protein
MIIFLTISSFLAIARLIISIDDKIFYYGVTHHTSYKKALVAQNIWGKRLNPPNGIVWYINKYIVNDSKAESDLRAHVISYYGDDVYNNITHRTLLIWEHVWKTYPSYQWYARVWDDNYIIKENFEEIISGKNYNDMVEYGRVGYFEGLPFIDGGASSLISATAVREFVNRIDECRQIIEEQVHSENKNWRECAYYCEDPFFSLCRAKFGITLHNILGLFHFSINRRRFMEMSSQDIACHKTVKHKEYANQTKLRSLHYVSVSEMKRIDKLWYGNNCNLYQNSWFLYLG